MTAWGLFEYKGDCPGLEEEASIDRAIGQITKLAYEHGNENSHVAFTVFSFDSIELPLSAPRIEVQRSSLAEEMMGEMGLAIYEHYGGKFPAEKNA